MNIIVSDDLASYLRQPTFGDDAADAQIVDLANGVVSEALGNPSDSDEPSLKVVAITLEVAARAVRNPGGYSSETIDDYTYRLPEEARRAGVYLTATELEELRAGDTPTPTARMGWLA